MPKFVSSFLSVGLFLFSSPCLGQPVCDVVFNGNEGTQDEYSVRSAIWHMNQAEGFLANCAYVDGPPWQACQSADWHLNEADKRLVQVFTNATGFKCWLCDPGNRGRPQTLIGAASRLSYLDAWYENASSQQRVYENTLFNVEAWLSAHGVYCEICDDGIDNDMDGLVDCDDPDCDCPSSTPYERACSDGIDNDGDGFIDCDDLDCTTSESCHRKDWEIFYYEDEWTCCKSGADWSDYPYQNKEETPHPIRIAQSRDVDSSRARILKDGFKDKAAAEKWLCDNHEVRQAYNWIKNLARVEGVLVSNLPCTATIP